MRALEVNHLNYHRLQKLAKALGKPVSELAGEAINEWMDTDGEPILKALERRERERAAVRQTEKKGTGRLVEFPTERKNGRKPRKGKD